MEERSLTHPTLPLPIVSLAVAAGVTTLAARLEGRRFLRLVGLWVYLAVVSGGWLDAGLLRAALRASGDADADAVVPYWGRWSPAAPLAPGRSRSLVGRQISRA